jgi:hypothetical protein
MRAVPLVVVLMTGVARGQGEGEPARAHFDRGAALAAERKYEEAARSFQAAYELGQRKEALFAWAQVERLRGNCVTAIPLYRKFLASAELTPAQIEAAELSIHRCEAEPEAKPEPPPPPAPAPIPAVAPAPPVVVTVPAPARSHRSVVATGVMLGAAVACTGASATFFLLSRNDERQASSAEIWQDYYDAARRARDRQRLAAGLFGAGVLLGGGALLQWLASAPVTASAWIGPGGVAVAAQGRF